MRWLLKLDRLIHIFVVASGGFIGALLRYTVITIAPDPYLHSFPTMTLIINLIGCILLGFLFTLLPIRMEKLRLLIGVGAIGSFTTFSTFSVDAMVLLQQHVYGLAVAYITLTLIGGPLSAYAGIVFAKMMTKQKDVRSQ